GGGGAPGPWDRGRGPPRPRRAHRRCRRRGALRSPVFACRGRRGRRRGPSSRRERGRASRRENAYPFIAEARRGLRRFSRAGTVGSLMPDAISPGSEPEPGVGTRIGVYELVRRIGDGAMGVVFEGRHTVLSRRVAIKLLRAELAQNPDVVARFLQEA